jgi:hypothetical protein
MDLTQSDQCSGVIDHLVRQHPSEEKYVEELIQQAGGMISYQIFNSVLEKVCDKNG